MVAEFGSVVLVNFDPSKGHEIKKTRPAVVVSNDVINFKSPLSVIVPLTTNLKYQNTLRFLLKKDKTNGLSEDSVIVLEQIKSIDKERIVAVLGKVTKEQMKGIQVGLDVVLNRY